MSLSPKNNSAQSLGKWAKSINLTFILVSACFVQFIGNKSLHRIYKQDRLCYIRIRIVKFISFNRLIYITYVEMVENVIPCLSMRIKSLLSLFFTLSQKCVFNQLVLTFLNQTIDNLYGCWPLKLHFATILIT